MFAQFPQDDGRVHSRGHGHWVEPLSESENYAKTVKTSKNDGFNCFGSYAYAYTCICIYVVHTLYIRCTYAYLWKSGLWGW